jgi:threonine/homoserine/homoserine lactone efflux protein
MDPQALAGFAAVSIALAFTPGADWAYCIAAGLGRARIFPAIAGLIAGYGIHTLLLVAGMAALVASLPGLVAWMTVFGAGYLLWLGVTTVRGWRQAGFNAAAPAGDPARGPSGAASPTPAATVRAEPAPAVVPLGGTTALLTAPPTVAATAKARDRGRDRSEDRRAFLRGLGTSGTNPKALLLYLALIPQFVSAAAAVPPVAHTAAYGLGHLALSAVVYSAVAAGARRLLRSRPAAARIITLASGIIMMGLGAVLLSEQLPWFGSLIGSLLGVSA